MRFIYTKPFIIFCGCVVALILFVFLDSRGYLDSVRVLFLQAPRPIINLANGVTTPVKGFFSTVFRLGDIVDENVRLSHEVLELKQTVAKLEQVSRENEALRSELGLIQRGSFVTEPCTVLARDPLDLTDTLILDCGVAQGIAAGQAVLSQGYLAGRVLYAGDGSSTVLLITNFKFSGDAKITKNGSDAIVRGSYGSGLFLEQVSQNLELQKGWQVVTAGINEQIPRDIPIGEVGEVLSGTNDLFKRTTLVTPVDFENLDFVFVIKK